MLDRVPLYPGRVKLTPVSGQANTYDMVRADQPTQKGTPLNKASLLTDATAALFGLGTDAVPDDVLSVLSDAALYKAVGSQAQVGTLEEGSIIYLNENGVPAEFYVAKQGYEPSYNSNRVLLVRKEAFQQGAWNSTNVNTYDGCTMDQWFNEEYLQSLDSDVQSAIGTTNIPYTPMGGVTTVQRISKSVFALSLTELGQSSDYANVEGTILPVSSAIYNVSGGINTYYTRSPDLSGAATNNVYRIGNSPGSYTNVNASGNDGYRPAFTLPSNFEVYTSAPVTGLYTPLGLLIQKMPAAQIVTGSYVGTGTYGISNQNSLTFEFKPKLVFIFNTTLDYHGIFMWECTNATIFGRAQTGGGYPVSWMVIVTFTGNTMSWYDTEHHIGQLNSGGNKYNYVAIG